jgi:hypothetical protein
MRIPRHAKLRATIGSSDCYDAQMVGLVACDPFIFGVSLRIRCRPVRE